MISLFLRLAQNAKLCEDPQPAPLNSEQESLNVWRHQEARVCTATVTGPRVGSQVWRNLLLTATVIDYCNKELYGNFSSVFLQCRVTRLLLNAIFPLPITLLCT